MSTTGYNKTVLLVFVLVFAALAANSGLTYWNLDRLNQNKQLVADQHHKIAELRSLLKLLVDAETGQRGYLITGEQAFLGPYKSTSRALEAKLAAVEKVIATNAEAKAS